MFLSSNNRQSSTAGTTGSERSHCRRKNRMPIRVCETIESKIFEYFFAFR